MPFSCSICGEESTRICVRCTKDSCDNHLCEKCRKCSDCCECEVALTPHPQETVREAMHSTAAHAEPVVEAMTAVAETAPVVVAEAAQEVFVEAPDMAPAEVATRAIVVDAPPAAEETTQADEAAQAVIDAPPAEEEIAAADEAAHAAAAAETAPTVEVPDTVESVPETSEKPGVESPKTGGDPQIP
jgi:hypothetical protein